MLLNAVVSLYKQALAVLTALPVNGLSLRCDLMQGPAPAFAGGSWQAEDVHMQHTPNCQLVLAASLKVLIRLPPLHPQRYRRQCNQLGNLQEQASGEKASAISLGIYRNSHLVRATIEQGKADIQP